jgi:hypothetical protein
MIESFLRRPPRLRASSFQISTLLALVALCAAPLLISQQASDGAAPSAPTVTFVLDFPHSNPTHYSIAVDAAGHSRYECSSKIAEESDDEPYSAEFEISAANLARIFDLTKQARYFAGNIDSGNSKLAFTGSKVLRYQDGQRSYTARYNYSTLAPVQQLTTLFQNMESTLAYGHRLAYYHRYQKLALDQELKHLEVEAKRNDFTEIQSIAPVLREIVEDTSVINVVRARAKELIRQGDTASGH